MSRLKTTKTIASTLTIAITLGFVVQYGESGSVENRMEAGETYNKAPRSLMMSTNADGEPVFGVPNVVFTPFDHASNLQHVLAVDYVYTELNVPPLGTLMSTPVEGCATVLSANREPAAMVALEVLSPCNRNQDFVVSHNGMQVSEQTNRSGEAVVRLPALVTDAEFSVAFDNVFKDSVSIFVPELRRYDRAVLQWASRDNMRLHALENGAQIGESGHVWSASLHNAEDTRAGLNGFIVYLGNTDAEIPYQAEIYTFPAGQMNRDGGVDLRVGVTVTPENCGREIDASTIQTNAGQTLVKTEITTKMPPCDQVGEVVLLRDQFIDLTLASN